MAVGVRRVACPRAPQGRIGSGGGRSAARLYANCEDSSSGKTRLGRTTKAGDAYRSLLAVLDRGDASACRLETRIRRRATACVAECLRDRAAYDEGKPNNPLTKKKTERLSFQMPAGALAA